MFKYLDKRVFIISLLGGIASIFVLFHTFSQRGGEVSDELNLLLSIVFGIPIFILFLRDKKYSWWYYVLYIFTINVTLILLEVLSRMFSKFVIVFFAIKFQNFEGLVRYVCFQTLLLVIVSSFISAFLFETFKRKSYLKKEKEL